MPAATLFIFTSKIAPYLLLLFLVVVTIDDVVYQLVRSDEKSPVTIKKSAKGEQKTNKVIQTLSTMRGDSLLSIAYCCL